MVQLWLRLFVALSELASQTFFCCLKHSGGSCSAAAREVAAVARGWCQQGTGVAARSCGGHSSRDELRAMAKAAGLPVRSNSKWLTVPELQEALLAYLVSEAGKVGSCLIASCMDDMCNWDEVLFLFYDMFSHCKDNGLFQINYWLDRLVHFGLLGNTG